MARIFKRQPNTEIERTYRYGHGPLVALTDKSAKQAYVALALGLGDIPQTAPDYAGPFFWHICRTCGYMEIIDGDPEQTINALGGIDG